MPFYITEGNIVNERTAAIVNAANTELLEGGGVCGVIFRAAGETELRNACEALAPIHTGEAVITPGFHLKASYIIHAAGPVYHPAEHDLCEKQLRSAYLSSLNLADEYHLSSIAFPLISSGIYGYPKEEALAIAVDVFRTWLRDHEMEIHLVIFDRRDFRLPEAEKTDMDQYLTARLFRIPAPAAHTEDNFFSVLSSYLKADILPELSSASNHTRRGIRSILSHTDRLPSKDTVLSLAIALKLNLAQSEELLHAARLNFDAADRRDGIIEYCLDHQKDIFYTNEMLFAYGENQL